MNPIIDQLLNRRTHRSFKNQPISEEHVQLLKEATLRAPTAGNMLFYSVIEVKDQHKKEVLARCCDNQNMIATAPLVWLFVSDVRKWVNYFHLSGSVEKGEQQGIAFRKPGAGDFLLANSDALIAAQSAVVAADSLGIGSCYIGDILEQYEEIVDLFDLPKYTAVATLLIFGYPKSTEALAHPSIRPPAASIFMDDSYIEPDLKRLQVAFGAQQERLKEQKRLPFNNNGTIADYFYFRKHISDFMQEMNRSSSLIIKHWLDE